MKTTVRGLAVLVLLLCAPLRAATIVQTFSSSGGTSIYGGTTGVQNIWTITAVEGVVQSVEINVLYSALVQSFSTNPFSIAQESEAFIDWRGTLFPVFSDGSAQWAETPHQYVVNRAELAPGESISVSGTFTDSLRMSISMPPGVSLLRVTVGSLALTGTAWGGSSQFAEFNGTVTFHTVPETSGSFTPLGCVLLCLLLHHLRAGSAIRLRLAR